MPDTTISTVDKSLEVLLKAEKDFQGYSLDFCSGYVSTDGVLQIPHNSQLLDLYLLHKRYIITLLTAQKTRVYILILGVDSSGFKPTILVDRSVFSA